MRAGGPSMRPGGASMLRPLGGPLESCWPLPREGKGLSCLSGGACICS